MRALLLFELALAATACGPEYEVLTTPGAEVGTGAGGTPSAGGSGQAVGGSQSEATGGGVASGEAASGGVSSGGVSMGGAAAGETGIAGQGGSGGVSSACAGHADCPQQYTCVGGMCAPCSESALDCSAPCPAQQVRVATLRNGCAICECAPVSDCTSDSECSMGEQCYRGAQCEEGCDRLDCCYGNHCGIAGCSGPPPSCNLSGCEGGGWCEPSCAEPSCTCNGMFWTCFDAGMMGTGGSGGAGSGTGAMGGFTCQGQCVAP